MSDKKPKATYTPSDKYAIACGCLSKETHAQIAERIGRKPIDIYQAMRSDWVKSICYAISRERGGDSRDLDLKYGGV